MLVKDLKKNKKVKNVFIASRADIFLNKKEKRKKKKNSKL